MSLDDELVRIERMSKEALRDHWRTVHDEAPPPGMSAKLIRGALMFDVQAKRFGGLSTTTRRKLERIALKLETDPSSSVLVSEPLSPGARLIREWGGKRHVVEVLSDGFVFRGAIYSSLSEIAQTITGAHWSGPRFFGLKNRRKAA